MPDVGDNDDVPAGSPDTVLVRNSANTNYETRAYSSTNFSGLAADDYVRYDGTDFTNRTRAQVRADVLLDETAEEVMLSLVNGTGANVNYVELENEVSGVGPTVRAAGSDTDVDLNLNSQGDGSIIMNGLIVQDVNIVSPEDGGIIFYDGSSGGADAYVQLSPGSDTEYMSLSSGQPAWEALDISRDTTPQLGGMLDENGQGIGDGSAIALQFFFPTGAPVNNWEIEPGLSGIGPTLRASGETGSLDAFFEADDFFFNGEAMLPTNIPSPSDGGILVYDGASGGDDAYEDLAPGTEGQVLVVSNGVPAYGGNIERSEPVSMLSVVEGDEKTALFTNRAITITEVRAVVRGTSPDITWTLRHDTDRSAAGTPLVTGGTNTTSESTGSDVTVFDTGAEAVAADSFVWVEATTVASTGNLDELFVNIFYTVD